jgi:hypothetical protein
VNRAIYTAATKHHLVRRVDDGVYRQRRYVAWNYLDHG